MNPRKIYWRRKEGKIIAEGKIKNKTIYLFQLPAPEQVAKSSLFTKEKQAKILKKISRLDYKPSKQKNKPSKVPIVNIVRTLEKND